MPTEESQIEIMHKMTEEEYFKDRLNDQINWYSKKSAYNQKIYKRLKILEILLASFIPFLSGIVDTFPSISWLIALFGISIAILTGLNSLYKYHENWIAYRYTSEALKQEKMLYLTQVSPYNIEDKYRFTLLVTRAENIMSSEQNSWMKYTKNENK